MDITYGSAVGPVPACSHCVYLDHRHTGTSSTERRRDDDANPNGSVNDIAGIYSENFSALGLMPYPENLIDPRVGGTDGRCLVESLAVLLSRMPQQFRPAEGLVT
jgi:CobB/CobQ-like glutamine amidotransferase domain